MTYPAKIALFAVSVLALTAVHQATAAEWPTRITRVLVGYGPGGGVDSFARPIASVLSERLAHRIIIENKTGAGGTIAVQAVHQSAPDGTTLLAGGVHQPMSEALYPDRGYRIEKDFVPVAITAVVPNVLVVPAASRFTSVKQIIDEAKANPGKLTYCSSGNGTSQHIIAEMFKKETGVNILHVPYRGTAVALTDLIANVCDMMFDGMGTSGPQIEGGKLRALAVTTAKRSPLQPNIATMKEAGGPAFDLGTWYAIWAPAAIDPALLKIIRIEVQKALKDPAIARAWKEQGAVVPEIADSELVGFVTRETEMWTKTVTELGIRT